MKALEMYPLFMLIYSYLDDYSHSRSARSHFRSTYPDLQPSCRAHVGPVLSLHRGETKLE